MYLGIVTPVLIQHPGTRSEWEANADITQIAQIAETADHLGFHHLTCSEHIAVPTEVAAERGGTYWDPLATLGYLAARTNRIRLTTQVLVLGYHHPLEIAKRYGTLDRVSNGRLVLGLGVGTLKEEFDLIDAPFEDRGARADDALAALRASLSTREPEYHGEFYDYSGFVVEPHAVQPRVPFWIGGRTKRSLRRALTHGDGWVPFGLRSADLKAMLETVSLPEGFDVILPTGAPLDPSANPEATIRALHKVDGAGATIASCTLSARSAEHYCDQLGELARLARAEGFELPTS